MILGEKQVRRRTATLAAVTMAGGLLLGSCGSGEGSNDGGVNFSGQAQEGSGKPTASSTNEALKVGKVTLNKGNLCAWDVINPEPLVSDDPLTIQIDGRCNFPLDESGDPTKDTPIGVNKQPVKGAEKAAMAHSGQELPVECIVLNDEISDEQGNKSSYWFKVGDEGNGGYVPEVNAGYGAVQMLAQSLTKLC